MWICQRGLILPVQIISNLLALNIKKNILFLNILISIRIKQVILLISMRKYLLTLQYSRRRKSRRAFPLNPLRVCSATENKKNIKVPFSIYWNNVGVLNFMVITDGIQRTGSILHKGLCSFAYFIKNKKFKLAYVFNFSYNSLDL